MDPLYIVASQLKIFTAVGTATRNVSAEKMVAASSDCQEVNMWWPHTMKLINAMDSEENATNR